MTEPRSVDRGDRATRRRAAWTVARAWAFVTVEWWVYFLAFTPAAGFEFVAAIESPAAAGRIGHGVLAVVLLTVAVAGVPALLGWSVYRSKRLYFFEGEAGSAALAVGEDRRRGHQPGDQKAHSFGAWPRGVHAGTRVARFAIDDVHRQGGRLTGTALPWLAARYARSGLAHVERRTWFLARRMASRPRDPHGLTKPSRSARGRR